MMEIELLGGPFLSSHPSLFDLLICAPLALSLQSAYIRLMTFTSGFFQICGRVYPSLNSLEKVSDMVTAPGISVIYMPPGDTYLQ